MGSRVRVPSGPPTKRKASKKFEAFLFSAQRYITNSPISLNSSAISPSQKFWKSPKPAFENAAWNSATVPAYSWKGNDSSIDEIYGKLYNYPAACCDICPEGWRLPGIAEFSSLSGIFGMKYGKHMKEVNGWPLGSLKSTNLSGLRILPSGARSGTNGNFGGLSGELATFWTSAKDAYGLPQIGLLLGSADFFSVTFSTNSRDGLSVRCVK